MSDESPPPHSLLVTRYSLLIMATRSAACADHQGADGRNESSLRSRDDARGCERGADETRRSVPVPARSRAGRSSLPYYQSPARWRLIRPTSSGTPLPDLSALVLAQP